MCMAHYVHNYLHLMVFLPGLWQPVHLVAGLSCLPIWSALVLALEQPLGQRQSSFTSGQQ